MSAPNSPSKIGPLLSTLLGVALVLVAGVNLVILLGIGWGTWQRATLSERWLRMQQEDAALGLGAQGEAQQLRSMIASARLGISAAGSTLPGDGEVAGFLSSMRTRAGALGVEVLELSPQPVEPTTPLTRRFTLQARGSWAQTVRLLIAIVNDAPVGTRFEHLSLRREEGDARLSLELLFVVRPSGSPTGAALRSPRTIALVRLQRAPDT